MEETIPLVLTNEEYFKYSRELDEHHALFYKMWEMGKPCLTKSVKTAAVQFDESGNHIFYLFIVKKHFLMYSK